MHRGFVLKRMLQKWSTENTLEISKTLQMRIARLCELLSLPEGAGGFIGTENVVLEDVSDWRRNSLEQLVNRRFNIYRVCSFGKSKLSVLVK